MTDVPLRPQRSLKTIGLRVVFVVLGLAAWFATQSLIAGRPFAATGVGDRIFDLTAGWNAALNANQSLSNGLLIGSSAVIDIVGCFLLLSAIIGPSMRPFVGLLMLFGLRQVCQGLVALPIPPGMIWTDPGFPSLLVTYGTATDLFFSGHTALAVYGGTEVARLGGTPCRLLGVAIAIFEATVVLVLRAHYTMDVYTGAVTALWIASVADRPARWLDAKLG